MTTRQNVVLALTIGALAALALALGIVQFALP
jgi:hypothetical protein